MYGPEQTLIYGQFSCYAPLSVVIWAYFHLKKAGNWKSVSKWPERTEMRIFIRLKALLSPAGRRQNLNRFQNQFQNLTDKRLRLYWCRSPFRRLGGGGEVGEGCQRGETMEVDF